MEKKEHLRFWSQPIMLFETVSLFAVEQAGLSDSDSPVFVFLLTVRMQMDLGFHRFWGFELKPSCLCSKPFMQCTITPALC